MITNPYPTKEEKEIFCFSTTKEPIIEKASTSTRCGNNLQVVTHNRVHVNIMVTKGLQNQETISRKLPKQRKPRKIK